MTPSMQILLFIGVILLIAVAAFLVIRQRPGKGTGRSPGS